MNRKDFLKKICLTSALIPIGFESCTQKKKNDHESLLLLLASGSDGSSTGQSCTTTCAKSPEETVGPYPSNYQTLYNTYLRSDIREDRSGIPLTFNITLVNSNNNCTVVKDANIYIWHCDRDGYYSQYSQPGYLGTKDYTASTFLRGIQTTDASGKVSFSTIFPGWYTGRVCHIHARVYVSGNLVATTQFAFPDATNTTVNNFTGYSSHGQNSITNTSDGIFSGSSTDLAKQLICISGNTSGYTGSVQLGISV